MESLISIVDDDEPVREALPSHFDRARLDREGFRLRQAASGIGSAGSHVCLIVDVRCRDERFCPASSAGRSWSPNSDILITGCPTTGGRKRALAAGVVSYLAKPFSEENLLDNIRLALARGAAGEPAAGTAANRLIQTATRRQEVTGECAVRHWQPTSSGWKRNRSRSCAK